MMDGTIVYTGTDNIAVLTIGGSGYTSNLRFVLRAQRATDADWSSEDSRSIVLKNLYTCDVSVMDAGKSVDRGKVCSRWYKGHLL